MNGKRISALAAIIAGAIGLWAATQLTGAHFGHDPRLGGADLSLMWPGAGRLYAPTAIFAWAFMAPLPWPGAFVVGFGSALLSSLLTLAGSGFLAFQRWQEHAEEIRPFGQDAWGTIKDAIRAGFVMGQGRQPTESKSIVTLGRIGEELLTVTDGRHIAGYGSSGSGKTRTLIIPTLLSYAGSVLVYTAGKMDVFELTSGFRSGFSSVVLLDIGNPDGWRFNPLAEVRKGTDHEIDDCRLIAGQFPPKPASQDHDPFWNDEGKKLLSAVMLHVLYARPEKERHLGTVRSVLMKQPADILQDVRDSKNPRQYVLEVCETILMKDERQRDGILGAAQGFLSAWASPIIQKVTSSSDFRISDLVAGARPMSLYLRLPSDQREEWRPVLKVLIAQVMRRMLHDEKRMPDGRTKRYPLLLALDEFHSWALPGFPEDLAEMRSYGAQALIVTQSPKTLEGVYGQHQTISANCRVSLYLDAADAGTQRVISDQIGSATEYREAESKSWQPGAWLTSNRSESKAEHTRALMDGGAVRLLPHDEMLLLATGCKPLRVSKLLDFNEREPFRSRLKKPALAKPVREPQPVKRFSVGRL